MSPAQGEDFRKFIAIVSFTLAAVLVALRPDLEVMRDLAIMLAGLSSSIMLRGRQDEDND